MGGKFILSIDIGNGIDLFFLVGRSVLAALVKA
jgi:hypothetical protein